MAVGIAKSSCIGSDTITHGYRVQVTAQHLAAQSSPAEKRWLYAYHIAITNESGPTATLRERHWIIVDADGEREEVRGEGVVGETPTLAPGRSHAYTSFCTLSTPWGTMEGRYYMRGEDCEVFEIEIGRFYLIGPDSS
jgi:ApaG protein